MLYKEIDDCEQCPLLKEEICPGGWTASPSGSPIEPPCCSFDDDTDLEQWLEDYYENQRRYEEYLDRKWEDEQEKKRKAEVAKKKRNYLKIYCNYERIDVKRAKKRLQSYKAAVSLGESIAFAFNTANAMFGYSERLNKNQKADDELKRLEDELANAEKKLKEKQKEGRKTEKYKSIK